MSDAFKVQLERALEQAVCQHFCQLFSVLMVKPDMVAIDRFKKGLEKLAAAEQTVGVIIVELP